MSGLSTPSAGCRSRPLLLFCRAAVNVSVAASISLRLRAYGALEKGPRLAPVVFYDLGRDTQNGCDFVVCQPPVKDELNNLSLPRSSLPENGQRFAYGKNAFGCLGRY